MALIDNPHIPRHARRTAPPAAQGSADRRASADPLARWRQVRVVEYGGPASIRVTTFTDTAVPVGPAFDRSGAAAVFAALAAEICAALDELSGVLR